MSRQKTLINIIEEFRTLTENINCFSMLSGDYIHTKKYREYIGYLREMANEFIEELEEEEE